MFDSCGFLGFVLPLTLLASKFLLLTHTSEMHHLLSPARYFPLLMIARCLPGTLLGSQTPCTVLFVFYYECRHCCVLVMCKNLTFNSINSVDAPCTL